MKKPDIDLAMARRMIAAAEARAKEIGIKATVVVLDHGGDLVAMARMDGAWPGAFDLALGKAQTARSFQIPSSALAPMIQPGEPLFAANTVCGGRYVILGGGLPIEVDGDVVGAVGVSGGAIEEDIAIAAVAAANFDGRTLCVNRAMENGAARCDPPKSA